MAFAWSVRGNLERLVVNAMNAKCKLSWWSLIFLALPAVAANELPRVKAEEAHVRGGLPNFFEKAGSGGEVRVAYLGGSITAQPGWRPKTLAWFQQQFPQAKFSEINAAIGGTGSDLGVFRLQHDVLEHRPDLLFIEFAVNDDGAAPMRIEQAMEGIVRQTWRANPNTDVCFVYTVAQSQLTNLDQGFLPSSAAAMEQVADHYAIPSIHMGVEVARLAREGKVIFKGDRPKDFSPTNSPILFSTDGVHPIPETGHELYLQAIVRSMGSMRSAARQAVAHRLIEPLRSDNWENARMIALQPAMLAGKWEKLGSERGPGKDFGTQMGVIWKATEPGATLSFSFKGTTAAIYDLLGPDSGRVGIKMDDQYEKTVTRMDGYCTYTRIAKLDLGKVPAGVHHVTLTLKSEQPDKRKILFEHNRGDFDQHPTKYQDHFWYASAIFILGELISQ